MRVLGLLLVGLLLAAPPVLAQNPARDQSDIQRVLDALLEVELQGTLKTAAVTIDQVLVTNLEASTTELQELVKEQEEDRRERRGARRQRLRR